MNCLLFSELSRNSLRKLVSVLSCSCKYNVDAICTSIGYGYCKCYASITSAQLKLNPPSASPSLIAWGSIYFALSESVI